jgi:hypothetical protein
MGVPIAVPPGVPANMEGKTKGSVTVTTPKMRVVPANMGGKAKTYININMSVYLKKKIQKKKRKRLWSLGS